MINCTNCGVELEENSNFCSLCGEPVVKSNLNKEVSAKSENELREDKLYADYRSFTLFQKKKLFWSISGFILFSGIIITLLIDFIGSGTITWSKFPATVSFVLFFNISLFTFLSRKIPLMLTISFLSVTAFFALIDIYAGVTGWDIKLGIPLLLAFYITFYALVLLIRNSKQIGLNVIASILMAAGLICVYTDGIISVFVNNKLHFGWSLIVLASVFIISLLLFYIHHRAKNVTDLKRFFHL